MNEWGGVKDSHQVSGVFQWGKFVQFSEKKMLEKVQVWEEKSYI